jgi:flagellin-like protein
MSKKGISPILASVLLLAVTISVAGVFSGWAPNLAQTVTDQTSNQTEHRLECNDASAEFISASYESTDSEINIALRNNGRADFEELILVAFDSNDGLMAQTNISIDAGNVANTTISSVNSVPSYVNLYSQECGDISDTISNINQ